MPSPENVRATVEQMRARFDASFAAPDPAPAEPPVDVVAVHAGGVRLALRRAELSEIAAGRVVVPLPGGRPPLLGVTSMRGEVLPVYCLARLIGRTPAGHPRWFASIAGERRACFAFDGLDGLFHVPPDRLRPGSDPTPLCAETALVDGVARPIVDLTRAARAGLGRPAARLES